MERKSAHNGPRSADATSPEGSENARRDGAHRNKPASGSFKGGMRKSGSSKFGDKFAGKSGGKFSGKKGFGKKRDDKRDHGRDSGRADRKEGWSPSVDARRETPDERSLRQSPERTDRNARPDRDDRNERPPRNDRGGWNNRGDRNERSGDDRRGNGPKREGGFDKGRRFGGGGGAAGFKGKSFASSPRMSGQKFSKPSDDRPKGPAYTPPTRALKKANALQDHGACWPVLAPRR